MNTMSFSRASKTVELSSKKRQIVVLHLSSIPAGGLKISSETADVFYLSRRTVVGPSSIVAVEKLKSGRNQIVLIGEPSFSYMLNDELHHADEPSITMRQQTFETALYLVSLSAFSRGETTLSFSVLYEKLCDQYAISSSFQARTAATKQLHSNLLRRLVTTPKLRQRTSVVCFDKLPSVIDVLTMLSESDSEYIVNSSMLPKYVRTTRKLEDNFPLFQPSQKEPRVPFKNFVFSSEFLNLSLKAKIDGAVRLNPNDAEEVGLPSQVDACIFRNFSILNNGQLHQPILDVYLDLTRAGKLSSESFVESIGSAHLNGKLFQRVLIDLRKLPIASEALVDKSITATDIQALVMKLVSMKAKKKFLDGQLSRLYRVSSNSTSKYTEEQLKVLKKHGLDASFVYHGVRPTKDSAESSDFYFADVFEFYLKGISSLPSIQQVHLKFENGKSFTAAEKFVDDRRLELREELQKMNCALRDSFYFADGFTGYIQKIEKLRDEVSESAAKLQEALSAFQLVSFLMNTKFPEFTRISETLSEACEEPTVVLRRATKKRYYTHD